MRFRFAYHRLAPLVEGLKASQLTTRGKALGVRNKMRRAPSWKFHTRNAGLGKPAFRTGRTRLVGRVPPRGGVSTFQAACEIGRLERRNDGSLACLTGRIGIVPTGLGLFGDVKPGALPWATSLRRDGAEEGVVVA